jgi:excisionase family DNA binding protein
MPTAIAEQDTCTTQVAADLLGVSLRTVQLWVEGGNLRAWKTPGGHRRVLRSSIDALLQERHGSDTAQPAPHLIKVLVVEDNKMLCRLYEATIKSWGIPVELKIVNDGFAALVAIGAHNPDIIITDISMPGMDGVVMLRKLREEHACDDSEIIVVTGLDAATIEEMGGLPSDVSVFLKPAPFALIQARIQAIANSKLGSSQKAN